MDTLDLEIRTSQIEDYAVLDIFVNYFNLIEEIRRFERPLAEREKKPGLAGAYEGILPLIVAPPSRHWWGEPYSLYKHPQEKLSCWSAMRVGCTIIGATVPG